jgi:hypothetical protein
MVMVDLDAVLFKDDVLRRAANIDVVVGQIGEIADALGELLVQAAVSAARSAGRIWIGKENMGSTLLKVY